MKTFLVLVLTLIIVSVSASAAEKTIDQLIEDIAVQDKGNNTCNTACGILVRMKDKAVPALQRALQSQQERIRFYAVSCLGEINTHKSREILIVAFSKGVDDVREKAAYALTWHPHTDAERVYIDFLDGQDRWYVRHAIVALGEIHSKEAIPALAKIRDNPEGWDFYYAAFVALRKIESKQLPKNMADAIDFLRKAKYASNIDEKQLSTAEGVIKGNIENVLPDVFNIYLWQTKGNESKVQPNAKTIIRDAGELAYPYLRISLREKDEIVSRKVKNLIVELGWESEFKKDL